MRGNFLSPLPIILFLCLFFRFAHVIIIRFRCYWTYFLFHNLPSANWLSRCSAKNARTKIYSAWHATGIEEIMFFCFFCINKFLLFIKSRLFLLFVLTIFSRSIIKFKLRNWLLDNQNVIVSVRHNFLRGREVTLPGSEHLFRFHSLLIR